MPWTLSDVDKYNKGLSPKQKGVWVKVANKALKACQDNGGDNCEASAIKQANAVVKKVKQEMLDTFNEALDFLPIVDENVLDCEMGIMEGEEFGAGRIFEEDFSVNLSDEIRDNLKNGNFTEAEDGTRTMVVTFIRSGWSKNGHYWDGEIVKGLSDRLVIEAYNQYVDHILTERKSRGRSLKDVASRAVESWTEERDGVVYGKAKVEAVPVNHPNAFIFDMAKAGFMFGPSVDTWVKVKKGEAEGKKGIIIESVAIFFAFDYVDRPAAGGTMDAAGEQTKLVIEGITDNYADFTAYADYWDKAYKFDDYHWWLRNYLQGLLMDKDVKDKTTAITSAIDEYSKLLKALPYTEIWKYLVQEEGLAKETEFSNYPWNKVDKNKLPVSAFMIVENENKRTCWHLPYRDHTGKINLGALESLAYVNKFEEFRGEKLDFKIPAEVRFKIFRLVNQFKITNIDKYKKEAEKYILDWIPDIPKTYFVKK